MLDIKNRETLEIYVLGDDFKFYQNLKYLPLTSYPSNNQSALIINLPVDQSVRIIIFRKLSLWTTIQKVTTAA